MTLEFILFIYIIKDIFLSIKDNNKHKNRTAKSFFVLEINPIQDPDDATGE